MCSIGHRNGAVCNFLTVKESPAGAVLETREDSLGK
jgi:hypothetical protein